MAAKKAKKKDVGRPPKPEGEKFVRAQIVMHPKVLAKGKADAKRQGLSFSAWVAKLVEES